MKQLTAIIVSTLLLSLYPVAAQDVPRGVTYKTTSEAMNSLAKSRLEQALASPDKLPSDLFGEVTVCGALLWRSLKLSADRVLLESKPIIMMVQVPEPLQAEGKRILTVEERASFWRLFVAKYPKLKGATVRKGKAEEISYYWATIPFDIEEPFYVVDTGSERFVAHFKVKDSAPLLFWIDVVGDLRTLKP